MPIIPFIEEFPLLKMRVAKMHMAASLQQSIGFF
jgi:hypothetical protein